MEKSKILLLLSGGTISMEYQPDNSLSPNNAPKNFVEIVPELTEKFDIDTAFVANVDSTNIQISHWERLATIIHSKYNMYDGFVVAHGTDTMSYTASAISYALPNLGKPIVFTGSQLPIVNVRSDARLNLINAFHVASMDLAEVVIVFGSKIIRANRSTKTSETNFSAFKSPKHPNLGEIRTKIDLFNFHKKRNNELKPELKAMYNDNIVIFTIHPGVKPEYLEALINAGTEGIIITAVGSGNVPNATKSIANVIKKATDKKIPVVVVTQCSQGTVNFDVYETGTAALFAGAISGQDMTIEAATTKLMWACGQTNNMEEITDIIIQNIAGELTTTNEQKLNLQT